MGVQVLITIRCRVDLAVGERRHGGRISSLASRISNRSWSERVRESQAGGGAFVPRRRAPGGRGERVGSRGGHTPSILAGRDVRPHFTSSRGPSCPGCCSLPPPRPRTTTTTATTTTTTPTTTMTVTEAIKSAVGLGDRSPSPPALPFSAPALARQPAPALTPATEATREEMSAAKLPLAYRDSCAHLLIPLNRCRFEEYYLPWKCEVNRPIYTYIHAHMPPRCGRRPLPGQIS